MTNEVEDYWFTAGEAAESLGIAPRSFRSWEVEAVATIGRNKYFTGAAILQNRLDARKRKRRRPETTADELKARVDELETELMSARAENQALRNSELRGELVRLDTLTFAIATASAGANAALESVPGKVKRAVPEITGGELNEIRLVIATIQNRAAGLNTSVLNYEVEQ